MNDIIGQLSNRPEVVITNSKIQYEKKKNTRFIDTIKVHVTSENPAEDGLEAHNEDPSQFSSQFKVKLPRVINRIDGIELVDCEIPNTAFQIHTGNNRVQFNEYEFESKIDTTDNSNSDNYPTSLTTTHNRFFAEITPGTYTATDYAQAIENAMNFGATNLNGSFPQNKYLVHIDPITGKVMIGAGTYTNRPGESSFGKSAYETVPFSMRVQSVGFVKSPSRIILNPQGISVSTSLTGLAANISSSVVDSYHRGILVYESNHGLIPGDTIEINTSEGKIQGVVCYVKGLSVHVLQDDMLQNEKKILNCNSVTVSKDDFNQKTAMLGQNPKTYQTGVVKTTPNQTIRANSVSKYGDPIGSNTTLKLIGRSDAKIDATFQAGSTHDCLTLDKAHLLGDGSFVGYGSSKFEIESSEETTTTVPRLSKLREPMSIEGYYPLYTTEAEATAADPDTDGQTSHSHVLGGVTYYIPGLSTEINTNGYFHGDHTFTPSFQRGNIFETSLNNTADIGASTFMGDSKLDLTINRRVVFIELEIPGVGPIGNIYHSKDHAKPFFARVQLQVDTDSIEFDSNSLMTGRYHFQNPQPVSEIIVRVYDENLEPFRSEGVFTSMLLDLIQSSCE